MKTFSSSSRRRGPIRRVISMGCGVRALAVGEFIIGPRFAPTRWLGRDDSREAAP